MMRRILAIFFLLLFTVSSTEAGQLLKLPLLISHLNEHFRKEKGTSVLGFFVEHYLRDHGNDGDSEQDRQLPFKSINNASWGNTYLKTTEAEISVTFLVQQTNFHPYRYEGLPSSYHPDIFHPPLAV